VSNFALIGQNIPDLWPVFNLFFKMAAVRHIIFLKFDNLTTHTLRRTNVCHHAKFHADRSSCSRDNYDRFSIFQNGERPPSWIFNTPIRTNLEEYLVVIVTV